MQLNLNVACMSQPKVLAGEVLLFMNRVLLSSGFDE